MQITNVMKYHYAKAVVFSFYKNNLLTADEYQLAIKKLSSIFKVFSEDSNDEN